MFGIGLFELLLIIAVAMGRLFGLKWGVVRVLVATALGGLALAQF